jgi:hypothetical protein
MVAGILGWSTIALLAVSFSGNNAFAGPHEDGLAAPAERDACMKDFVSLREEAEARGRLIKVASERHAPPKPRNGPDQAVIPSCLLHSRAC